MNGWRNLCRWLGVCRVPRPKTADHPVIQKLQRITEKAAVIETEAREIRQETGIWPQDMIRGTYRVNRRTVRREHS